MPWTNQDAPEQTPIERKFKFEQVPVLLAILGSVAGVGVWAISSVNKTEATAAVVGEMRGEIRLRFDRLEAKVDALPRIDERLANLEKYDIENRGLWERLYPRLRGVEDLVAALRYKVVEVDKKPLAPLPEPRR